eukprot:6180132-Heterocapsa_arctica.AAC.1
MALPDQHVHDRIPLVLPRGTHNVLLCRVAVRVDPQDVQGQLVEDRQRQSGEAPVIFIVIYIKQVVQEDPEICFRAAEEGRRFAEGALSFMSQVAKLCPERDGQCSRVRRARREPLLRAALGP